uniref:Uncharacterized protein n=1 Tax=Toxoplasma gondii COUG TaxID=1074873 RepID=A0A2G8XUD6_TOXGO|nr:hypothetical protein TGCOUG_394650 [Toxoplasma gondii COUG]
MLLEAALCLRANSGRRRRRRIPFSLPLSRLSPTRSLSNFRNAVARRHAVRRSALQEPREMRGLLKRFQVSSPTRGSFPPTGSTVNSARRHSPPLFCPMRDSRMPCIRLSRGGTAHGTAGFSALRIPGERSEAEAFLPPLDISSKSSFKDVCMSDLARRLRQN